MAWGGVAPLAQQRFRDPAANTRRQSRLHSPFLIGLAISEMSLRRARFTASELGNFSATSGSRTTTFDPSANRLAYLPRTPPEKSYSGRMSSSDSLCLLIAAYFSWCRLARADDPDAFSLFCVRHDDQS